MSAFFKLGHKCSRAVHLYWQFLRCSNITDMAISALRTNQNKSKQTNRTNLWVPFCLLWQGNSNYIFMYVIEIMEDQLLHYVE